MKTLRACVVGAMVFLSAGLATAAGAPPAAEAPGMIAGTEIARPGGGFLGLQIVSSRFVLSFYDARKHPAPVDVARAALRWPVKYQPADERVVLNPAADGLSLTSEKSIRPPHRFKVFLALLAEGRDEAVESYVVDFGG